MVKHVLNMQKICKKIIQFGRVKLHQSLDATWFWTLSCCILPFLLSFLISSYLLSIFMYTFGFLLIISNEKLWKNLFRLTYHFFACWLEVGGPWEERRKCDAWTNGVETRLKQKWEDWSRQKWETWNKQKWETGTKQKWETWWWCGCFQWWSIWAQREQWDWLWLSRGFCFVKWAHLPKHINLVNSDFSSSHLPIELTLWWNKYRRNIFEAHNCCIRLRYYTKECVVAL